MTTIDTNDSGQYASGLQSWSAQDEVRVSGQSLQELRSLAEPGITAVNDAPVVSVSYDRAPVYGWGVKGMSAYVLRVIATKRVAARACSTGGGGRFNAKKWPAERILNKNDRLACQATNAKSKATRADSARGAV